MSAGERSGPFDGRQSKQLPSIPATEIPPDLVEPIRALVRSASFTSRLSAEALEMAIKGKDPIPLLERNAEMVDLCDMILEAWRIRFGLDVEDIMDDLHQ